MARPRLTEPNYRLIRRGSRIYVRWWEHGQWQRISTGTGDERQAQRWLAQFIAGRGTPEPPAAPTIATILAAYLADRSGRVASIATLDACAKALIRHLGDLEPDHLTKERSRFYARARRAEGHQVGPAGARRKKPTSDGTIIRELVTLRAALRWAATEKWIAAAPAIDVPPAPPPRARWLSRDEAARLLDGARTPHVRLFLALALYTAARAGALLALRWEAVDMDRGLIDLGAGAGNKDRAIVPIAGPLLAYLQDARAMATSEWVIEHGSRPVASVKTGTRAAAIRAGLPGVTPHVLRHTAASWMVMAGVPMPEIARFLGHRDTAMVERVYGKHSPDYLRRAADALTGPLAPKTGHLAPKMVVVEADGAAGYTENAAKRRVCG